MYLVSETTTKLLITIFLHAHLQVVYYKCAKFHINPKSGLGGVALTRYHYLNLFSILLFHQFYCWDQQPLEQD
jgi:hypothetical protein